MERAPAGDAGPIPPPPPRPPGMGNVVVDHGYSDDQGNEGHPTQNSTFTWEEVMAMDERELETTLHNCTWGRITGPQRVRKMMDAVADPNTVSPQDSIYGEAHRIVSLARMDTSPKAMLARLVFHTANNSQEHFVRGQPYTHADKAREVYSDSYDTVTQTSGESMMSFHEFWGLKGNLKGLDYTIYYMQRDAGVIVANMVFAVLAFIGGSLTLSGILLATVGGWSLDDYPVENNWATMILSMGITLLPLAATLREYIRISNVRSALKPRRKTSLQHPWSALMTLSAFGLLADWLIFYGMTVRVFGYSTLFDKATGRSNEPNDDLTSAEEVWYDILFWSNIAFTLACVATLSWLLVTDPSAESHPQGDLPSFSHCMWDGGSYVGQHRYHCHKCHRCTTGFDHHCDFINQCICDKNYRVWFVFVVMLALMGFTQTVATAVAIGVAATDSGGDAQQNIEQGVGYSLYYFLAAVSIALQIFLMKQGVELTRLHVQFWWRSRKGMGRSGHFYSTFVWEGTRQFASDYEQGLLRSIMWNWSLQASNGGASSPKVADDLKKRMTHDMDSVVRTNFEREQAQVYYKLMASANEGHLAVERDESAGFDSGRNGVRADQPGQSARSSCCRKYQQTTNRLAGQDPYATTESQLRVDAANRSMLVRTVSAGQDGKDGQTHRASRRRTALNNLSTAESIQIDNAAEQLQEEMEELEKEGNHQEAASLRRIVAGVRERKAVVKAQQLNPRDVQMYRKAFELLDQDGDDLISCADLRLVMSGLTTSASVENYDYLISFVDGKRDGYADFEEFCTVVSKRQTYQRDSRKELNEVYNRLCDPGAKTMTSEQLKRRLMQHDPRSQMADETTFSWPPECDQEWDDMWCYHDKDGDGCLSPEEFVNALTNDGLHLQRSVDGTLEVDVEAEANHTAGTSSNSSTPHAVKRI